MRTSLALVPVCLLALAVPDAFGQNPFAGTWQGTSTGQYSKITCTCSGAGCAAARSLEQPGYFSSAPWYASIDGQGNLTGYYGAGTVISSFSPPFTGTATKPVLYAEQVQPDGTLTFSAVNESSTSTDGSSTTVNTETCPPLVIQFSLSPPRFSGGRTCSISVVVTGTSTSGSYTESCQQTYESSWVGFGAVAPPFPMTVSSDVNATTATATAQVQPPSQLAGTVASVYVFAHAPQSALATKRVATGSGPNARDEDGTTPDPCVLAQLNANGQLVAASASSLAPYVTGVVGSESQTVTLLNNVPTSNVAGASFYVGYGQTSNGMLSSGLYEGAVTVPGTNTCSTALLTAAAPNNPGGLSGLWWNAQESGWGVSFAQRRNIVFAAWYTYDASGQPHWYVASNCAMPANDTGTTGTCKGDLYEVTGPTFFGANFDSSLVHVANVGTLRLDFQDAANASMTYSVNGQNRTVPITRQIFQTGSVPPAVDYTDLWWNTDESGWGLAVTQQYGTAFLAWFVYDANGKPVWYVATSCPMVGSGCSGTLYQTAGPPLGPAFDPSAVHATAVGKILVNFNDANHAQMTYTVNGVTSTRSITRQLF